MDKRALAVAVAAVTLLVAGCSSSTDDTPAPSAAGTGGPAPAGTTAAPTVEQEHTVPAPGPRQPGLLAPADLLVVSGGSIPADVVEQIDDLPDVSAVAISLSESVIENKSLTVAAVDPASYRTFTPQGSADFQEAWDRVAGGEMALKKRLQKKVPTDANGYLKLGAAADAPAVHVGAYVDQQPLIDAVVNPTWVESLGMTPDNALLVRTGTTAPAAVQKKIEAIVGDDTAVTLVDLATRRGLQPGAAQVAVVTGSVDEAVGVYRYTVLAGGRIAPDPAWVREHIATETVPILGSVTCNKLLFPQLRAALIEVQERGLADKIDPSQYAGCFYPRFIAGTNTLSNHAFGLALDINTAGNQRGTVGELDRGVVDIFKKWGFAWGGDWKFTDPMHFEMAQLVSAQAPSTSAKK